MSYPARVYRILIASPSDVTDEREIAVKTIQEWNDLNSAERQLVLLPLRWETHTAPEFGRRPQEVINRQVVDHCDLLIGVFWTRIGTPTGLAESGTIEEIARVAKDGKPVMLYFSQAKQDPDKIDLEQLKLLRDFKKNTYPKALIENYSSVIEFRDKLAKQLEIQLRSLLAEENAIAENVSASVPYTDIRLHFAEPESGADIGQALTIKSRSIDIPDFATIPDYKTAEAESPGSSGILMLSTSADNKDYYRDYASFLFQQNLLRPIRFWLNNAGGIGARDVFLDIELRSEGGPIIIVPRRSFPTTAPTQSRLLYYGETQDRFVLPAELMAGASKVLRTQLEVRALQPKREISPASDFLIGALSDCQVTIHSRIYADTLPEPTIQTLKIEFSVEKVTLKAEQIISQLTESESAETKRVRTRSKAS